MTTIFGDFYHISTTIGVLLENQCYYPLKKINQQYFESQLLQHDFKWVCWGSALIASAIEIISTLLIAESIKCLTVTIEIDLDR
jgi:hypothetical protein